MPFWEVLARIVGGIAALALVLLLAWVLLRWMNSRLPGVSAGSARVIRMLDRVRVGKSDIVLLRVKDKVFLLAVSEHSAETVQVFDDPEGDLTPKPPETPAFSAALRDAASRLGLGGKNRGDKP